MNQLKRLLVIAIIVVAALGAGLALLLLNPPGRADTLPAFSDRAVTDIVSVQVQNLNGEFSVASKDGGYIIDDIPSELIDIDRFIAFMETCSAVSPKQRVKGEDGASAEFGLDDPSARIAVNYSDGNTMELSLGSEEALSGDYYCSVDGVKGVYLISRDTAENFLLTKQMLISFYITPKLKVSSPLSAVRDITFTGGPLAEPVTIESVASGGDEIKRLARSFGAATHVVRGAGAYELDQSYGLTILEPLCGLTADAIAGYGYTREQEDELFKEPYMTVELDYANGAEPERYLLRFVPADEAGTFFYANASGSGVVYIVARKAFFDISYDKLLLRWFLSPLMMDVSGITVETDGKKHDFAIDNSDLKNPVVTMNGKPLDTELFRSFYKLLGSAANDGSYLGRQGDPSGAPDMTITYRYTDGKENDTMELYPGVSRRSLVYVNGVCEFAMKDAFITRARQAVTAMEKGEDFDINW